MNAPIRFGRGGGLPRSVGSLVLAAVFLVAAVGCTGDPDDGDDSADAVADAGDDATTGDGATGADGRVGGDSTAGDISGDTATHPAPEVKFTAPANGAVVKGKIKFEIDAKAAAGLTIKKVDLDIDSALYVSDEKAPWSFVLDTNQRPEGEYKIGATAHDSAGGKKRAEIAITIDRSGPEILFKSPLANAHVNGDVTPIKLALEVAGDQPTTVAFSAIRKGKISVLKTLKEAPWQTDWSTKGLEGGAWTLRAIGNDKHGNSTTTTVNVVVDRGPKTTLETPKSGQTVFGTIDVKVTCEDDVGLTKLKVDTGGKVIAEQSISGTKKTVTVKWNTVGFKPTFNVLTATCFDGNGQFSNDHAKVTVDQKPVAALKSCTGQGFKNCTAVPVVPAALFGTHKLIAGVQDDDATLKSVALKLDGKPLADLSKAPFEHAWDTTKTADGPHKLDATFKTSKGDALNLSFSVTINNCDTDKDGHKDKTAACGGLDCDDKDKGVFPGAADPYGDGKDSNCDGKDGKDADGDGYFDKASGGKDCNDSDKTIRPCADDKAGDGIDSNCDGKDTQSCDDCDSCSVDTASGDSCLHIAFGDGNKCSDGNPCSTGDTCNNGSCIATSSKDCNDGNLCTADSCSVSGSGANAKLSCKHTPSTGACFDGDACTVKTCIKGVCKVGGAVKCDDGIACTEDKCDAKSGCFAVTAKDGAACATGCKIGVCKTGTCNGSVDGIWQKIYAGSTGRVMTIVPAGKGEYFGVGYAVSGLPMGFIMRFDGAGKAIWQKNLGASSSGALIDAAADGKGGVIAGGVKIGGFGGTQQGAVSWISSTGSVKKTTNVTGTVSLTGITVDDDGNAYVAGGVGTTSPNGGRVVALSTTGSTKWTQDATGTGKGATLNRIEYADGHVVAVGAAPAGNYTTGFARKLSTAGKTIWTLKTQPSGYISASFVGLSASKTGWVAGGAAQKFSSASAFAVGIDNNGKKLWERAGYATGAFWGGIPAGSGVLMTGIAGTGSKTDGLMVRIDANGNPVWTKTVGGNLADSLVKGVAVPGGFLLPGDKDGFQQGSGKRFIMRIDSFGNSNCTASGTCAGKSSTSCEDTNPCTLDTCDGKSGCKHSNMPDKSPCGGGKTCKAGTCG